MNTKINGREEKLFFTVESLLGAMYVHSLKVSSHKIFNNCKRVGCNFAVEKSGRYCLSQARVIWTTSIYVSPDMIN